MIPNLLEYPSAERIADMDKVIGTFDNVLYPKRDFTESINYARRIQEAILPDLDSLNGIFSENFVFYQPKDIVSGDFYWFAKFDDCTVIVVGDCCGHGVPGAFISMLGVVHLNFIVRERHIKRPDVILSELNTALRKTLCQYDDGASDITDGIDLAVFSYCRKRGILKYAGAKNDLYHVHNGALNVIKGDRYGIGGPDADGTRSFRLVELNLTPGDFIYLSTDGYIDQFGGNRCKRFSSGRFRELVTSLSEKSFITQKHQVKRTFYDWKGHNRQTDDVLVFGAMV